MINGDLLLTSATTYQYGECEDQVPIGLTRLIVEEPCFGETVIDQCAARCIPSNLDNHINQGEEIISSPYY